MTAHVTDGINGGDDPERGGDQTKQQAKGFKFKRQGQLWHGRRDDLTKG